LGFVLASKGYPGKYDKGVSINNLDKALEDPDVKIYHMGTAMKDGHLVTNGGRVMMVLASGSDLMNARDKALAAADKIECDNLFLRRDIGWRVMDL